MKERPSLKAVISLTAICLITALTLGVVNYFTAPIIKRNDAERENRALRQVLPQGENFGDPIDISSVDLDKRITAVYRETAGAGYVFKVTVNGYGSGMVILCGIGSDGVVCGALCLSSSETLGYEKTYGDRFVGHSISDVMDVDTVSGASLTTKSYREAVRLALESFGKLIKEED